MSAAMSLESPERSSYDPPTLRRFGNGEVLVIGLVNCMAEAARQATERQFRNLLGAASFAHPVELRLFSLPDFESVIIDGASKGASQVDGVIVTGVEPRGATLPQEPCWAGITCIADWAQEAAVPIIWSCLAAHVAALHLGGVVRKLRPLKLSGLFECNKATDHPLLAGLPLCWRVPHSRWYGLEEGALVSRGYQIISRSAEAGTDMFVGRGRSLSLFVQGHPEYEPQILLLEYRRDIGRFLTGDRDHYPMMPAHYFDERAAATLTTFRETALRTRRPELLTEFPTSELAMRLTQSWHEPTVRLYANWLSYLSDRKSCSAASTSPSLAASARVELAMASAEI